MRKRIALAAAALGLGVAFHTMAPASALTADADLVLKNGNIYTVDDQHPHAEAVAVDRDRIVFVGSNADVAHFVGPRTRVVDLGGLTVVPGMTDAHHHLGWVGVRELSLNLDGADTKQKFLEAVRQRAAQTPPGAWITGQGWIETFWKPPVFPTRADLDAVAPNNPVYLLRADTHGAAVNSAALKIAGVDRNTKDPFGGHIARDASGEPSGMLMDAAEKLVSSHIPPPTVADNEKALEVGGERDVRLGWCEIQDAGGSYADVDLYKKLIGSGRLKLRIVKAVYGPGPEADRLLRQGPEIGLFNHHFTLRTIKVVYDGALGSRGAALLEPYSDAPDTSGYITVKDEALLPMLEQALRDGIQVQTHAIGDRANRRILDMYEKAMAAVPANQRKVAQPRWRVEHAQVVSAADIPRFAKLGIIPSMQPSHAIDDLHFAPARLGMDRLAGAYAWQSFIKSGCIVPGGSDAPVSKGEPMDEFYAAVARRDRKGYSGPGWHPEQAVSREQALRMFTLWPAIAAFEEKSKGSIEVGKLADFTVLSADIMHEPMPDILTTHCMMTIIGGEIVNDETRTDKP
jgi:predicted amidohydrolase YtcJ